MAMIGLFFLPNFSFGQLYEVSLDDKIKHSTTIVVGEVIKSQCYRDDKNDIYTAHKVKITALLKGNLTDAYVTVTTWGGELDGEMQTWTHLLNLNVGERGFFFLNPTVAPSIKDDDFPASFDVYAASQGFIKFIRSDTKAWIGKEPFHTYYNIPEDLYAYIQVKTGQNIEYLKDGKDEKRSGIRYHFTDIGLEGSSITFSIYVNSLMGNKKLYKSGVQLGYNPAFFGSNIATSGNLLLQDAGISLSSTYDLTQSNVTSSKVKIELVPVSSLSGLTEITTSEQLLAKGKISVVNYLADPGIVYDIAQMQGMSKFYEGGVQQVFDTVIVEGDWKPESLCKPQIKSFSPNNLAAGVGDILTISGSCFGLYLEGDSYIQLTNAAKGLDGTWSDPIVGEYVLWTDTLIKVKVHSVGAGGSLGGTTSHYAGSGKFIV
jgi:hypothetical protein